jgi:thiamine-phosphate pyrophosphorylase
LKPPARPATRLILMTPRITDVEAFATTLAAACGAADVAAVIADLEQRTDRAAWRMLAAPVQAAAAAFLTADNPEAVVEAGADGAHVTAFRDFAAARERLTGRIVGAGGLRSRDDAMSAAAGDADYVLFGEPDARGTRPGIPALLERIEWWSEVIRTPCVGFAATLEEVTAIARAGADFVALREAAWDATDPALAIAEAGRRLGVKEPA